MRAAADSFAGCARPRQRCDTKGNQAGVKSAGKEVPYMG
jgi:hypothetical protein